MQDINVGDYVKITRKMTEEEFTFSASGRHLDKNKEDAIGKIGKVQNKVYGQGAVFIDVLIDGVYRGGPLAFHPNVVQKVQYIISASTPWSDTAYIFVDGDNVYTVAKDGVKKHYNYGDDVPKMIKKGHWKITTKEDAESRLNKPVKEAPKPKESNMIYYFVSDNWRSNTAYICGNVNSEMTLVTKDGSQEKSILSFDNALRNVTYNEWKLVSETEAKKRVNKVLKIGSHDATFKDGVINIGCKKITKQEVICVMRVCTELGVDTVRFGAVANITTEQLKQLIELK